ncbi:TPA: nucleoid-associated protein [Streptococcus agalactiae]
MMDFYIKQIIIHQFSPNDTELVLSDTPLTLTPRIDDYFRKKLSKVFSDEAKRGYFGEDNVFMSHLQDDLYVSSCQIAQLWKEEFVISEDQKTNDLVFIQFDKDGMEHFAFLRISLKEQFAHVSENLLQVQPEQSVKKSIKMVEQTAQKIAENFNKDDFSFQSKMKSAIYKNLEEEQELSPEKLADQLFDDNLTARLTFVDELKDAIPGSVQVSDIDHSRQIKKLENQKLSLSNGIELIVPNNVYQDAESVEFIQNPDGTYSILIKNIQDIQNK